MDAGSAFHVVFSSSVREMNMSDFPSALPHGDLEEIFPDVFVVKGQIRIDADQTHEFSRNMTVLREGKTLTLINTVRLDGKGLAFLETLGEVRHIIKLGGFHGRDDGFYVDRYGAELWAPPLMVYSRGEVTTRELLDGQTGPVGGSTAFVFNTPELPEAILHLQWHGGILITCDSFQNASGPDQYFNEVSAENKRRLGFFGQAVIGPGWRNIGKPDREDLQRLTTLNFQHLLSAHGEPLLDNAHAAVSDTIARF